MTYRVNGRLVTKEEFMVGARGITPGKAPMIHSRQPFVSPIDGEVITSAKGLREHEIRHSVLQVGDEYVGVVNEKRAGAKEAQYEKAKEMQQDAKNFSYY